MNAAPEGVGWGTTNIPEEKRIDITKEYRTARGGKVLGLTIQLTNSCDNEVTFPVKGSIKVGRKMPRYCIWTLDGKADLFTSGMICDDDLVEMK